MQEYLPGQYKYTYSLEFEPWPITDGMADAHYQRKIDESIQKVVSQMEKAGFEYKDLYYRETLYADGRPYIELITLHFVDKTWPPHHLSRRRVNAKMLLEQQPHLVDC